MQRGPQRKPRPCVVCGKDTGNRKRMYCDDCRPSAEACGRLKAIAEKERRRYIEEVNGRRRREDDIDRVKRERREYFLFFHRPGDDRRVPPINQAPRRLLRI